MRIAVLPILVAATMAATTAAGAFTLRETRRSPQADAWISAHFPEGTIVEGIPATLWTGTVQSGKGTLDVARVASVSSCEREDLAHPETCATVITGRDGRILFSGSVCGDASSWSFSEDAGTLQACGRSYRIAD